MEGTDMATPKVTQKAVDKYNERKTPRDPYERGKADRAKGVYLPDKDAQAMPSTDWQNYIDGRMGRDKRK